jgi:hypothetical protein
MNTFTSVIDTENQSIKDAMVAAFANISGLEKATKSNLKQKEGYWEASRGRGGDKVTGYFFPVLYTNGRCDVLYALDKSEIPEGIKLTDAQPLEKDHDLTPNDQKPLSETLRNALNEASALFDICKGHDTAMENVKEAKSRASLEMAEKVLAIKESKEWTAHADSFKSFLEQMKERGVIAWSPGYCNLTISILQDQDLAPVAREQGVGLANILKRASKVAERKGEKFDVKAEAKKVKRGKLTNAQVRENLGVSGGDNNAHIMAKTVKAKIEAYLEGLTTKGQAQSFKSYLAKTLEKVEGLCESLPKAEDKAKKEEPKAETPKDAALAAPTTNGIDVAALTTQITAQVIASIQAAQQ